MTLRYLLDTNVLIDLRKRRAAVVERIRMLQGGEAAQSVITYGELLHGASKSTRSEEARRHIAEVARLVPVLPLSSREAEFYGSLRAGLEVRGETIGANDLWIAAHAIAAALILVTNNEREFLRVPGLRTENWAR